MEAIPILLIIFGSITAWVLGPTYLKHRREERLKALETGGSSEVKALSAERDQLEERVRHLEDIVCSVDFELNAKLNRIATQQLMLPPPSEEARAALPESIPSAAFYLGTLEEGARVADRFVIEQPLGAGGMGAVYRAHDEKLGEKVALKVIRDAHVATPAVLERFRREVSTARRIHHPNVVRIHDLGEEGQTLFISMEYVEGESLRSMLRRHRKLPLQRIWSITSQILDALQACHDAGVVHRDLKPENVLLTGEERVKLIDFGIAKLDRLHGLTATNAIIGTPQYMAPEQIRSGAIDPRTDLYALGIIVHEMLSGHVPFTGPTAIAVGFAHCHDTPPRADAVEGVPKAWGDFVVGALEKDPASRYGSAEEMRGALPAV